MELTIENKTNFPLLIQQLQGGTDTVSAKAAQYMVEVARDLVPVDTGRLQQSIQADQVTTAMETGVAQWAVTAGDEEEVDYAVYVEYGTSRTPAQPFMEPAAEQTAAFAESEAAGWLARW